MRSLLIPLCVLLLAGCAQLEMAPPEGNPNRVLTGTVRFREPFPLPDDATVVVRIVDASHVGVPAKVLGSQTIHHPGTPPFLFSVDYVADDELLRRGLSVDARISYGGRLRFFNREQYAVTYGNAGDPHTVWVGAAP